MDNQVISALVGAFVVLSGIAVLAALILGFKAIGAWVRSTLTRDARLTGKEVVELRETVEALKAQIKPPTVVK